MREQREVLRHPLADEEVGDGLAAPAFHVADGEGVRGKDLVLRKGKKGWKGWKENDVRCVIVCVLGVGWGPC